VAAGIITGESNECTRARGGASQILLSDAKLNRCCATPLSASACVVRLEISAPVLLKFVLRFSQRVNLTMGAGAHAVLVLWDAIVYLPMV
jgi:hypothetical protein